MTFYLLHNEMAFKNTKHLIPKQTFTYIGEHEVDDWSQLIVGHPLLAYGSGSYSESQFGILHPGYGRLTKVSFNAFPVQPNDELKVQIRVGDGQVANLTFVGSSGSMVTNIPINNQQFAVWYESSTYAIGRTCLRVYLEVTDL
jgi:hypothetical protein